MIWCVLRLAIVIYGITNKRKEDEKWNLKSHTKQRDNAGRNC